MVTIASIFLGATLLMSYKMNIWMDEAYSMHTAGSTVMQSIKLSMSFEEQPPAYFFALCLWRHINHSIFFARLFSVLCILCAGFFMFQAARGYSAKGALFLFALFLINPLALWAATEIRVYGLIVLFSSIIFWSFHAVFILKSERLAPRAIFLVASVLSLYTQYFSGCLHIVNIAFLLLVRDWRSARRYCAYMVAVALCFVPFFVLVTISQVTRTTVDSPRCLTLAASILQASQLFFNLFLPGSEPQLAIFKVAKVMALLPVIFACFKMRKTILNGPTGRIGLWPLLGMALGILIFSGLVFMLGDGDFMPQRYVLFFLPEMMFLVFFVAVNTRPKTFKLFLSIAFLAYYCATGVVSYYPMKKDGDWKQVARFIEQNASADEPVFIYFPANVLPFSYYFHRPNHVVPVPVAPRLDVYDTRELVLADQIALDTVVNDNLENSTGCWFVDNSTEKYRNKPLNAHLLPEFIQRHFTIIAHCAFKSSEVYHVKKKDLGSIIAHNIKEAGL